MTPPSIDSQIKTAADLIKQVGRVLVFTGAGISTPSGIPDFRSHGIGLWSKHDPMRVASMTAFQRTPEVFYDWLRPLVHNIRIASPNPAHRALAELELAGFVQVIITQNIDGLHQASGSKQVLELHGSVNRLICQRCKKTYTNINDLYDLVDDHKLPLCADCQQVLKPDIILFEEMLPQDTWAQAEWYCETADLMLVIGSSLEVTPAAELPRYALQNGSKLIILNLTPTYLDSFAELVLTGDAAVLLPEIARIIS